MEIAAKNNVITKSNALPNDLARARAGTAILAVGLILSGLTCYFLPWELDFIVRTMEALSFPEIPLFRDMYLFVAHTREGLGFVVEGYPQMLLGTDYLGFAHVLLGLLFLGAMADPARNVYVLRFGVLCCLLVIPAAFFFGQLRGAPILHRFGDASFGVIALVFTVYALKAAERLEKENGRGPIARENQPAAYAAHA